jgi:hypothetical protein
MSVFGFNTEPSSGGEFTPVVKYDARAGRIFRVDRDNIGGEWVTAPTDITKSFKAIFDLENLETGWIDFNTGAAPVFALAKIGEPLPPRPTPNAKNGVRLMMKLSKECGGDKPVREMASSAKAFLQGLEELFIAYQNMPKDEGKLPVVTITDTIPIKSGSGDRQSTNYKPQFKITAWAPRGDLEWKAKNEAPAAPKAEGFAPQTGSTRVDPPKAKEAELADSDDFG